jgi:putative membrane protein
MMWDNDYGWGAWLAMTVGMVAFWALIAVVAIAVVRSMRANSGRRDEAARLLETRFAQGDIDEQEFRARRDLLRSGR